LRIQYSLFRRAMAKINRYRRERGLYCRYAARAPECTDAYNLLRQSNPMT